MFFISIQGGRARSFYLEEENRRMLYRKLRSFLDRKFLLINSPFKTDMLYESEKDHNRYIIKLLYDSIGRTFLEPYISNFYRSDTIQDSLENYFSRILHLSIRKEWQGQYLEELGKVVMANPNNPVLHKVIDCYSHFDVSKYTIHIPTTKGRPNLKVTPDNARQLVLTLLSSNQSN